MLVSIPSVHGPRRQSCEPFILSAPGTGMKFGQDFPVGLLRTLLGQAVRTLLGHAILEAIERSSATITLHGGERDARAIRDLSKAAGHVPVGLRRHTLIAAPRGLTHAIPLEAVVFVHGLYQVGKARATPQSRP